jgi:hypothetical protein
MLKTRGPGLQDWSAGDTPRTIGYVARAARSHVVSQTNSPKKILGPPPPSSCYATENHAFMDRHHPLSFQEPEAVSLWSSRRPNDGQAYERCRVSRPPSSPWRLVALLNDFTDVPVQRLPMKDNGRAYWAGAARCSRVASRFGAIAGGVLVGALGCRWAFLITSPSLSRFLC